MKSFHLLGGALSALAALPAPAAEPRARDLEPVVVTAAPIAIEDKSMAQPASVLGEEELALALSPTIGETVAREPGVSSTYFGPAASRPVIRGLGGDRVQVLTDGLATHDAAGVSEDHAVAVDPALADQVEVLRGPSTLLFGSGAAGGLVNVVTNRLHDRAVDGASGVIELRGDSALGERAVAGRVDAGAGDFVLHLDGAWRDTDDFEVPDEVGGEVPNSWSETRAGGAGVNWIGDAASLGAAISRHDTEYGVPNEDVHIDLVQDRVDVAARLDLPTQRDLSLRLRGAASDYEHSEIEPDGAIGTKFDIDSHEFRAALTGRLREGLDASLGLQWQEIDLLAIGEEAFVPESQTRAAGLFGFARLDIGAGVLEAGLRLDRQEIDSTDLPGYDEEAVNGSLGLSWPVAGDWLLIGQLVRSARHPSATELFADGPHAATQQFERGDPTLGREEGWTAEFGLRRSAGRVTLDLRGFASRYDDYIVLEPTGEIVDGLPVFQYVQRDARFHGVEAEAAFALTDDGATTLRLLTDYVRGELDAGSDLPRIPPWRLGAELAWQGESLGASLEAVHSFEQDQVTAFETTTESHTLVSVALSWRPDWARAKTLLFLKGRNLLDEVARVHSSPLKDSVPLPGRSVGAGIRIEFE